MSWRVSSSKMWSLGKFKPSNLSDEYDVKAEFRVWAKKRLSSLKVVEVRAPDHPYSIYTELRDRKPDMAWHHDFSKADEYIIVWSNLIGTYIRVTGSQFRTDPNKFVYQGAPGEVVMFDNLHFQHRTPPIKSLAEASDRWFIRSVTLKRGLVRDVSGIYQYQT